MLDVDLLKVGREAPMVGMLGALRMLPEIVGHLLHGERPAKAPESMRLQAASDTLGFDRNAGVGQGGDPIHLPLVSVRRRGSPPPPKSFQRTVRAGDPGVAAVVNEFRPRLASHLLLQGLDERAALAL